MSIPTGKKPSKREWKVGTRVHHYKHGYGRIVSYDAASQKSVYSVYCTWEIKREGKIKPREKRVIKVSSNDRRGWHFADPECKWVNCGKQAKIDEAKREEAKARAYEGWGPGSKY